MCINCPFNDKFFAPFGGFLSSGVAKGVKINGKSILSSIAAFTHFEAKEKSIMLIIISIFFIKIGGNYFSKASRPPTALILLIMGRGRKGNT